MPNRPRHLLSALAAALITTSQPVLAAAESNPAPPASEAGMICIAPFDLDEPTSEHPLGDAAQSGPAMSFTPSPSWQSSFTFRVDRRLTATVRNHEMGMITGVPSDRKVKVEVMLDEKPFETFWLDLGKNPEHRVCLWLKPGYWHWIDQGWTASLGCRCDELPPPVDPETCPPEGSTCS